MTAPKLTGRIRYRPVREGWLSGPILLVLQVEMSGLRFGLGMDRNGVATKWWRDARVEDLPPDAVSTGS